MHVIDRRYQTANPDKVDAKAGMSVVSYHEDLVGQQRPMLLTLFAAVGCVLLVGSETAIEKLPQAALRKSYTIFVTDRCQS